LCSECLIWGHEDTYSPTVYSLFILNIYFECLIT
jgi:hypothetical protein